MSVVPSPKLQAKISGPIPVAVAWLNVIDVPALVVIAEPALAVTGWTLVVVTDTEAKDTVALPPVALAELPLSAGAPPVRLVHPVCWNIQVCGSAVPAAQTFPSRVPLFSWSWNQYHVPTCQLKV